MKWCFTKDLIRMSVKQKKISPELRTLWVMFKDL